MLGGAVGTVGFFISFSGTIQKPLNKLSRMLNLSFLFRWTEPYTEHSINNFVNENLVLFFSDSSSYFCPFQGTFFLFLKPQTGHSQPPLEGFSFLLTTRLFPHIIRLKIPLIGIIDKLCNTDCCTLFTYYFPNNFSNYLSLLLYIRSTVLPSQSGPSMEYNTCAKYFFPSTMRSV